MDLVKKEKQKRVKGVIVGAIFPFALLAIVGLYGFYIDRESKFTYKYELLQIIHCTIKSCLY